MGRHAALKRRGSDPVGKTAIKTGVAVYDRSELGGARMPLAGTVHFVNRRGGVRVAWVRWQTDAFSEIAVDRLVAYADVMRPAR